MKKIFLLASGISLCLAQLMAAAVSVQDAQTVAINFYKGNVSAANTTATLKYTRTESDGIIDYYVFDIAPKGFVIVSADDNIQPVIGYSGESLFRLHFEHTAIQTWLDHAAAHIHKGLLRGATADARISGQWATYRQGPYGPGSRSTVAPLLSTTWDQEPYYNDLCPYYTPDNQRAVTGCVATSMAQIMKFWSYPTQGVGSYTYIDSISHGFSANYGVQTANFGATTYAWTSMPASINNANNPIATLMYHCGVSVAMDYGDNNQGGSGAWVIQAEAGGDTMPCSEYAFRHYFSYDTLTLHGIDEANYTSALWVAILKNDLDAGRPIQYEGDDVSGGGGHAWVCDGYDANDMFHMNWGWSGSSDGYFSVNSLTAGGYNFSSNEGALTGIQPPPPFQVTAQAAAATVCLGTPTTLTATGPASATYSWTPTTGLACATCAVTTAQPATSTIYTVIGDSAGVQVRYSVTVNVSQGISASFSAPTARACSAPATISFTNNSQYASTYSWNFGDGTALSTDTSPVHTYTAYGVYPVSLYATGSCGVDSMVRTQYITISDIAPSATGASVCNGTSATLTASATSGTSVAWYTADSAGSLIDTNLTFHTPAVMANTTYYLESLIPGPSQYVGPAADAFGSGSYFTGTNGHSIIFDCVRPQTLVSVDVYSQGGGVETIKLMDSYGNVLDSVAISVPNGQSTVTLNFSIPVGTNFVLTGSGNANLYRNQSGAAFPYYATDSAVVLTGADVSGGYYYFFYHWKLQAPSCTSARVPVVVSVMNGSAAFVSQDNGLTVNFTPSVTTATTYQWSFGDGSTSTSLSPSHTYAATGVYTVQLVESNGSCSDTTTQLVTAVGVGITEITALQNMSVYPVPAHDELAIRVNASKATAAQMTITDILGKTISIRDVQLTGGTNTLSENVATYAPGVYVIALNSSGTKATAKFVKE